MLVSICATTNRSIDISALTPRFSPDGVVTVNRIILKPAFTVDDLEERLATLCENVKTYHSETGFVGGYVMRDRGAGSDEGSTMGRAVESHLKNK